MRAQLAHWLDTVVDHRRLYRFTELNRFSQESAHLVPLPRHPYDTACVIYRLCSIDGFVAWEGNRYAVPYEHVTDILLCASRSRSCLCMRRTCAASRATSWRVASWSRRASCDSAFYSSDSRVNWVKNIRDAIRTDEATFERSTVFRAPDAEFVLASSEFTIPKHQAAFARQCLLEVLPSEHGEFFLRGAIARFKDRSAKLTDAEREPLINSRFMRVIGL
jgi:hypothetical protein